MKQLKAVFETSAAATSGLPRADLPEIVFTGRSNVGKSSLLNSLTGSRGLAKVSSTPGKTRLINFFRVEERMRFVDLPGYGYAKVGAAQREGWVRLIRGYFDADRPRALVVQLVDSRHDLQDSDAEMIAWFVERETPLQIVLTKIDKLKQAERARLGRSLLDSIRALGCGATLIGFSAVTGLGRLELLKVIFSALPASSGLSPSPPRQAL